MVKYRKTALVEAEQFLPPHQIPAGCYQDGNIADVSEGHGVWMLKTREGPHALRFGDYVCTGAVEERWNVEQPIFEATYEVAALHPTDQEAIRREALEEAARYMEGRGEALFSGSDNKSTGNMMRTIYHSEATAIRALMSAPEKEGGR